MEKTLFLLFGIIFLTGCGQQKTTDIIIPKPPIIQLGPHTTILSSDTWNQTEPQIIMTIWTWRLIKWLNGDDNLKKKYVWTKVVDTSNEQISFETTITWYLYTYIYKDLWIKIATPPLYEPYFSQRTEWLIFKRQGDMIYLSWDSHLWTEYIQKFSKDPSISFFDSIKKSQTPAWCRTDLFTWIDYPFLSKKNDMVSARFSDTSITENTCIHQDKKFPNNDLQIVFIYNPQNPSAYYKVSFGDWCAPGPCSIFNTIEFF